MAEPQVLRGTVPTRRDHRRGMQPARQRARPACPSAFHLQEEQCELLVVGAGLAALHLVAKLPDSLAQVLAASRRRRRRRLSRDQVVPCSPHSALQPTPCLALFAIRRKRWWWMPAAAGSWIGRSGWSGWARRTCAPPSRSTPTPAL